MENLRRTFDHPEPPSRALLLAFSDAGVRVEHRDDGALWCCVGSDASGRTRLIELDEPLGAAHAQLLRAEPNVLFAACEHQDDPFHSVSLKALTALVANAPVIPPQAERTRLQVSSIQAIHHAASTAGELISRVGGTRAALQAATDVTYELVANAVLDAPVDEHGAPRYAHRRHEDPDIAPEDAAEVALAVTPEAFFVAVKDRFGRMTAEPLARTMLTLHERAKVDVSGGGAGLGLRRIFDASDLFSVRVAPGRSTEALAVVRLGRSGRKRERLTSLFFRTEGA